MRVCRAGARGASAEERWAEGMSDARNPGDPAGALPQVPGVELEGYRAREALTAAATITLGRGNPRGLLRRLASWVLALESRLLKSHPGGAGAGRGGACFWLPPPRPLSGSQGVPASSLSDLRAVPPASRCLASQPWGCLDSLLELGCALPRPPCAQAGRAVQGSGGGRASWRWA